MSAHNYSIGSYIGASCQHIDISPYHHGSEKIGADGPQWPAYQKTTGNPPAHLLGLVVNYEYYLSISTNYTGVFVLTICTMVSSRQTRQTTTVVDSARILERSTNTYNTPSGRYPQLRPGHHRPRRGTISPLLFSPGAVYVIKQ